VRCPVADALQGAGAHVVGLAANCATEVFHHHRHPGEVPGLASRLSGHRCGLRPGSVVARVDDGVDGRVAFVSSGNGRVDQLGGGDVAAAHQVGLSRGIEGEDVVEGSHTRAP